MFDSISHRFEGIFSRLQGKGRLTEADVDAALADVRVALLEADVNVAVARTFLSRIRERALGEEVRRSLTPGQQVVKIVHEELVHTLGEANVPLRPGPAPSPILVVGLQGSGKTTTAGKLALHLKNQGRRPLLVAADLQRPAAIDQLQTLGERIEVPVFTDRTTRPPRLVRAALKEATRLNHDVVVIDTAGRLQIDAELMKELGDIAKEAGPRETLLVVDAMTGQEAVNVARGFAEQVEVTGLILTKLDGDARGGAAISAREVTGVPIKFVGVGEALDGLEAFHPERMASRILGMGDVLTLIEKAEETFDQAEAEKAAAKMQKGAFTLEDFLQQFQAIKRMGPLRDVIAMLPGAGSLLREVNVEDRDLNRVEAIIRSMTPEERRNPKVIGQSRKNRIASGSGTTPQEVNQLLRQFADAQKMMKLLAGGRGLPGLAGLTGSRPGPTRTTAARKKKKKGKR
ncbi:MAG TPA: signal recognition particle protein [Acidimicrobiia bacterium]|nr:signal recognition particle protein [Acidimicrobiia bacterium]